VAQKVDRLRKLEKRSRSKLIGEALERYFSIRVVRASKPDLTAMRLARAEIKAGKFVTLDEALHGLETPDRKTRRKRTPKNSL
jgi:predicted transcriptional regulator